jgi:hypothetical protein
MEVLEDVVVVNGKAGKLLGDLLSFDKPSSIYSVMVEYTVKEVSKQRTKHIAIVSRIHHRSLSVSPSSLSPLHRLLLFRP